MILLWIDDRPEICTIVTAFCDRIGGFIVQIQIFVIQPDFLLLSFVRSHPRPDLPDIIQQPKMKYFREDLCLPVRITGTV